MQGSVGIDRLSLEQMFDSQTQQAVDSAGACCAQLTALEELLKIVVHCRMGQVTNIQSSPF